MSKKPIINKNKELTIEEKYKKKTQHEHILSVPGMWVGSIELDTMMMWVYNSDTSLIENKEITMNPGLYKIFDEALVNARDHSIRDKTCKNINVDINKDTGEISIYNDGNGIDVEIHKEHKIYIPEMIFGNLLTSTNYEVKGKTVGGLNGLGIKINNIFSTRFQIETIDAKRKKLYKQVFENNMFTINPPVITDTKNKPFTRVSFIPDYKRFNMKGLTGDMISLFEKRVHDLAACTNVNVALNGKPIKIKQFENYIRMFYSSMPSDLIYEQAGERWKVGVVYDAKANFNHMSFVNGICTYQGGNHVTHVLEQICSKLLTVIKAKHKDVNVKPSHIRDNLSLFVDCVIEDPAFSSQTKEYLTTKISSFGSRCEISDEFIKKLSQTGIVDQVIQFATLKEMSSLKQTDGKKTTNVHGIEKLCDATWAGTRKSNQCCLILTEGDSAKAFALAGLEVIGREKYGVFPLRGKPLNVRDATAAELLKNKEFTNIKQIMGLKQNKNYKDTSQLRYAHIMILTDADYDGSHIKGLLINMFHCFWPSLLKIDGFIQTIQTPIVKMYKKSDVKKKSPIIFYTITDYKKWTEKNDTSKYTDPKYYKGLGTSTEKEAIECFKDFDNKLINYIWESAEGISDNDIKVGGKKPISNDEDVEDDGVDDEDDGNDLSDINSKSYESIILAFGSEEANNRKIWLNNYNKNDIITNTGGDVTISDFVNKDLIHFSKYNVLRAIPSVCDSFKPSQRKVLFGCFKRKVETHEIKVAQLGAYIAEHTEYHHGEKSLFETIIKMAQNFVDSNNLNLLLPLGNFGYRRQGGDEAASERYIFTKLNKVTGYIFRSEDNYVLNSQYEDGTQIEPETFAPIIPMVLVNGVSGIGTGWSTDIPCFNPLDIIKNIQLMIKNKDPVMIHPWYNGFKGKICKQTNNKYLSYGCYEIIDENIIRITEIPIGSTIDKYKKFLESAIVNDKKPTSKQFLTSVSDLGGNNTVNFEITFYGNCLQKIIKEGNVEKTLKLISNINMSNMYLHNTKGIVTKYDIVTDIFDDFFQYRLGIYKKRKEYMVRHIANHLDILKYKVKFIQDVLSKKIVLERQKKSIIIEKLESLNYPKLANDIDVPDNDKTYKYITDMPLFALTEDMIDSLNTEYANKQKEYDDYLSTPETDIWNRELEELVDKYNKWLVEHQEEMSAYDTAKIKKGNAKTNKAKK